MATAPRAARALDDRRRLMLSRVARNMVISIVSIRCVPRSGCLDVLRCSVPFPRQKLVQA